MSGSSRTICAAVVSLAAFLVASGVVSAAREDSPALKLRATMIGAAGSPLTVELFRWSSDAERAPLQAAFSAPPPAPAAPAATAPAAGRGRAGRGGRGNAPPPLSPEARIAAAIKSAPTFGYIWGEGATGYSVKYAWRSSSPGGAERIVLVTDRRLGSHVAPLRSAAAEQDYTVVELRVDARGSGEGKTSLATRVVVDAATNTLALDGYASAPAELKVTR